MEYAPVTSATAQGVTKKSLEILRAKTTSGVSSARQMLEELVRKYEEHRDKKYDNDLKLQRLYDILPKLAEQQLLLEDRDGSATHESVKRRANNWIMMNSTERADMDLGRWEMEETTKTTGDSSGDLMGLKEERWNKERGSTMVTVTSLDTRQRIVSQQQQCAATVHSGDIWQSRALTGKRKQGKVEHVGEGTGKTGKGRSESQKGEENGKGKRFQSVSDWNEWDQTDECTSVPILSVGCGEKTARNRIT